MLSKEMVNQIIDIVGKENVILDKNVLTNYSRSVFMVNPEKYVYEVHSPTMVVIPNSTEDVSRIVSAARANKLAIYLESGGTDTVGGTMTLDPNSITLDLRKMNRLIELDREGMYVRVQASVGLQDLEDTLRENNLTHGHRPGSFQEATVAGSISHYGVGMESAGFGLLADNVMGMVVVLANGEILRIRSVPKSSMGEKNLLWLYMGSQGRHGIVTEVTVRVFPFIQDNRRVFLFGFETYERGVKAAVSLNTSGFKLTLLSVGMRHTLEKTLPTLTKFRNLEAVATCVIDSPTRALADVLHREIEKALKELGGTMLPTSAEYEWMENRKNRVLKRTHVDPLDWSIWTSFCKPSDCLRFITEAELICSKYDVEVVGATFNIQPMTIILRITGTRGSRARSQDKLDRFSRCRYEVLSKAIELGGTADSFHALPLSYAPLLRDELGDVGVRVLTDMKRALDEQNTLNRGKDPTWTG